MAQQDDYFYEIQLSNKQLVFYFMAGATGLILSFLAGVMVGRGVDQGADVQASRTVPTEERVVAEEPVRPVPPPAEDLTYAQRLESEKSDEGLEKPGSRTVTEKPAAAASGPAVAVASAPAGTLTSAPAATLPSAPPAQKPVAAKPSPKPQALPRTPETAAPKGQFTIQVGAFKDRASADSIMGRLKGKGLAAYVVPPATPDGLFNVRVGSFGARPDAERTQSRLRDQEKFKPFIVKN